MQQRDKRVDSYIEKSAPFAQPILHKLRALVHEACPEVQETIKWSYPVFEYKGILCSMAAFKQHCVFYFWKGALLSDPYGQIETGEGSAMGQFRKVQHPDDLPQDALITEYIREAMELNDKGIKLPTKPAAKQAALPEMPPYFQEALKANPAAQQHFDAFSNSNKREYIEWLVEAKQEATRQRRLKTALDWIAEGKVRNWKYIR